MKVEGSIEAARAESIAAKEGMKLVEELGITALVLESDAQIVIESFESSIMDLSYNRLIMLEAFRVALDFNYFKAQCTPRNCNSIADRVGY